MKLLSIRAAAELWSVSPMSIKRWIADGTLQHVRLGKCIRLVEDNLNKVLTSRIAVGQ